MNIKDVSSTQMDRFSEIGLEWQRERKSEKIVKDRQTDKGSRNNPHTFIWKYVFTSDIGASCWAKPLLYNNAKVHLTLKLQGSLSGLPKCE